MAEQPPTETVRCVAHRVRLPGWIRGFGVTGMVVSAFMFLIGGAPHSFSPALIGSATLLLFASAMPAFLSRRRRGGELLLEPDGIRLRVGGGERAIRREDVEEGYEIHDADTVVLRAKGGQEVVVEIEP